MQNRLAAKLMDGKLVGETVRGQLKAQVDQLIAEGRRRPGLAVLLIGDNPASQVYVKNKIQACKKVGIESILQQFSAEVRQEEVLECLQELNAADNVDGILVQLPLPRHLASDVILDAVAPQKDADGLHPLNLGLLVSGKSGLRPCTPQGIMVLLDHYEVQLSGKRAVVIGRSNLVGKPISLMLMEKNATVTMCHSKSVSLDELARTADVLVVAAGQQGMVKGSWIKPGAVVVDVGIHRVDLPDGHSGLAGDVEFAEAAQVASLITPVPGGVGPMTIAMLLANTLAAYEHRCLAKQT